MAIGQVTAKLVAAAAIPIAWQLRKQVGYRLAVPGG